MKSLLTFLTSLQIALAPSLVLAQNSTDNSNSTHSEETSGPLTYTDSQTTQLENGDAYTSESTVTLSETDEDNSRAETWFVNQIENTAAQTENLRVVGVHTEGQAESDASKQLVAKLSPSLKVSTATIKQSLFERIKTAARNASALLKKPFAAWVEKRPSQFKKVFAITRGGINGVFSSFVFNYYFLDGAIPTWLAWTVGITLGTMSGAFNYFSDYYSHWLDRKADLKTHELVLKFFPFLKDQQIDEMKSMSKWGLLESIFLAIPILFFQYLPDLLGAGEGYSFADSWLSGAFALSMSFVTAMLAQYPWDKGISRAHTADTLTATDTASANWVKFRTAMMYVVISILQVTTTSLSLGDFKVSSYVALGGLGLAGMLYRYKTIKRTNALDAQKVLKNTAPNCRDLLSLSWVTSSASFA